MILFIIVVISRKNKKKKKNYLVSNLNTHAVEIIDRRKKKCTFKSLKNYIHDFSIKIHKL